MDVGHGASCGGWFQHGQPAMTTVDGARQRWEIQIGSGGSPRAGGRPCTGNYGRIIRGGCAPKTTTTMKNGPLRREEGRKWREERQRKMRRGLLQGRIEEK